MTQPVTFWFEFASTYSYLSAMRIEHEAARRNVSVVWKPFTLGPIFAAQGWNTSPFSVYPSKGRYMWRDMERRTRKYGLPFQRPTRDDPRAFPQNSIPALRIAVAALTEPWGITYCRNIYTAQFADNRDISTPEVITDCIISAGGDPDAILAQSQLPEFKPQLRANTEAAQAIGIFGAPSFTVGEELFWGDDRLEDALDWAAEA